MNDLRLIGRTLKMLTAAVGCWAAVHATALAQTAEGESKASGPKWVMSYALVLLGVGLGLLLVCRSSRRRDRAKPEQYGEGK